MDMRASNMSSFRFFIEELIRTWGTPLQVRDNYWVWNDQYPHNRRRLKWWGIRIQDKAFVEIQKACENIPGVERVYRNGGNGKDLCIIINKPLREIMTT